METAEQRLTELKQATDFRQVGAAERTKAKTDLSY
jgi:hypothetical protein